MLIVAGEFTVAPEDREEFLEQRQDAMRSTRGESGCLEYVMSADPLEPSRVVLFERWADQESLDAHMKGLSTGPRPGGPAPQGVSVEIYDISGTRSFG